MLHSETLARTIHADRVRAIEQATTWRRLLAPPVEPVRHVGPAAVVGLPATPPAATRDSSPDLAA